MLCLQARIEADQGRHKDNALWRRPGQQTWHVCTCCPTRPDQPPLLLPVKSRESTSQLHARRTHTKTPAHGSVAKTVATRMAGCKELFLGFFV
jgi:hypothetical protein